MGFEEIELLTLNMGGALGYFKFCALSFSLVMEQQGLALGLISICLQGDQMGFEEIELLALNMGGALGYFI